MSAGSTAVLSWLFLGLIFITSFCQANVQIQSQQAHQIGFAGFMDPGFRREDVRVVEKSGQAKTNREEAYGLYSSFLRYSSPAGNILTETRVIGGVGGSQIRRMSYDNLNRVERETDATGEATTRDYL